ncbi:MAG: MerR family transcriptional regulator [Pseudomonadota bacterium]
MLIGTFSRRVGLSVDTLRYYEKIGLMPQVDRTHSGRRRYSSDHVAWVDFLNVLKSTGMGVNDMARYVDLRSKGISSINERREMLVQHRKKVTARRRELEESEVLLKEKIDHFQSVMNGDVDGVDLTCATGEKR